MDTAFIQGRIDAIKIMIVAYEDALLAIAGGALSYTLDTGQSRQTVTRQDVRSMQKTLDSLYNTCATLGARLNGGVVIMRPEF